MRYRIIVRAEIFSPLVADGASIANPTWCPSNVTTMKNIRSKPINFVLIRLFSLGLAPPNDAFTRRLAS